MVTFDKQFKFILSEFGSNILIGSRPARAVLQDVGELSSTYFSDKILNTDERVKSGSVVQYDSVNWLAIKQENNKKNYSVTRIREALWNTNFIIDEVLFTYPSFYTVNNIAIDGGSVIDVSAGKIVCCVPYNPVSNKIDINDRFIKFNYAWKITGVDRSNSGLLYIHADMDSISAGDDLINEIPAGNIATYTMNWETTYNTIPLNNTTQVKAIVYKNNIIDNTKQVVYSTSPSSVAYIDSDGTITPIEIGTFTVTATAVGTNVSIEQTIEIVSETYTIQWVDFPDLVKVGQTEIITTKVYKDGVVFDTPVLYESSDTNVVTIDTNGVVTGITNGTATIKATIVGQDVFIERELVATNSEYSLEWQYLPDELYVGEQLIIGVKVLKNGVVDSTAVVDFSIDDTAVAEIIPRSRINCWVKGLIAGAVKITATLQSDNNIKISNVFNIVAGVVSYTAFYNFDGGIVGTELSSNGLPQVVNTGNRNITIRLWKYINGKRTDNLLDQDSCSDIVFTPPVNATPPANGGINIDKDFSTIQIYVPQWQLLTQGTTRIIFKNAGNRGQDYTYALSLK